MVMYDVATRKDLDIQWAAAAVHKPQLVQQYGIHDPRDVFVLLYKLLLERLQGWLQKEDSLGRLFLDQQHDRIVSGRHNEIIADHHRLQSTGTGYLTIDRVIDQPFFMQSKYSNHIQIADLFAYNVKRQLEMGFGNKYSFYERILPCCRGYRNWWGGHMQSPYGLKVFPVLDVSHPIK